VWDIPGPRILSDCNRLQQPATLCNTPQHLPTNRKQTANRRRMSRVATQQLRTAHSIPTRCNTLQHTATHCNTLEHAATHYNTPQHTATATSHFTLPNTLQRTATHCNTLQHTATAASHFYYPAFHVCIKFEHKAGSGKFIWLHTFARACVCVCVCVYVCVCV